MHSFRTGDKRLGDLGFQQIDYAVQIHLVRDVVVVDHFHLDLGGGVLVDDLPLGNIAQQLDVVRGYAHIVRNLCGVVRDVGQQTRCRIVRQVKTQLFRDAVLEVCAPVVTVGVSRRILDFLLVLNILRPPRLILDLLDAVGVAVVERVQTAGDVDLHARNKVDELLDRPDHTADDADNILAELQKQNLDRRNRVLEHVAEEVDKVGNDVVDRQIEHVVDERACHRKQAADHADGARRFVLCPVRVVDVRRDNADQNDDRADNQHDRVERHHGIEHFLRGSQRLRSRGTDLRPVGGHRKQRKGCRSRKHKRTDDLNIVRHPVDGFEQWLQCHDRHVAGLCPDVRPGERNLAEFLVGFLCRGQQCGLDNARRQLALLRHAADFTDRYAEVIRNRLNDSRCLLEYRIQLLASQHAGAHGLRDLQHGGGLTLGGRAGNLELLVQLLDKRDRFLIAAECVTGKQTHLRDRIRRSVVRAARTHSRLIDQLLQVGGALQTVVHQIQTRRGLCHFV